LQQPGTSQFVSQQMSPAAPDKLPTGLLYGM